MSHFAEQRFLVCGVHERQTGRQSPEQAPGVSVTAVEILVKQESRLTSGVRGFDPSIKPLCLVPLFQSSPTDFCFLFQIRQFFLSVVGLRAQSPEDVCLPYVIAVFAIEFGAELAGLRVIVEFGPDFASSLETLSNWPICPQMTRARSNSSSFRSFWPASSAHHSSKATNRGHD